MRPAVLYTLVLIAASATGQGKHGPPPSELVLRCGSQIDWQPSFEAAMKRAQQTRRPIFWYLRTVPGSPMDRKAVLDIYMRAGPFSAPDVVNAINRRFVPLKEGPTKEQAKRYRLAPLEFVEPGFLVLKPDGTEIGRVDRITTFHDLWFVGVLNKIVAGAGELGRPADVAETRPAPDDATELGLLELRKENWAAAEASFAKSADDQARYLRGVALYRLNRQPEAQALWRQIAASSESPWAAKAAAELSGFGPFSRGFEEYGSLPEDAIPEQLKDIVGTQRAREPKDLDWLVRRSVRYLLERQNPDGGFDDSNYDFGGRDSLPDVYVAVTALSALALLEWKAIEPERIQTALARAVAYLSDESHVATDNLQERVWAHSYRALFFSKVAAAGGPLAEPAAAKLRDVVKRLQDLQAETGQFAHEYPNPFATATAIHALKIAEAAGVPTTAGFFNKSAGALRGARGEDGTYSYGFERQGGSRNVDMAGGRMPTCELALLLCGASNQEKLGAAIKTSLDHHAALERSRKYDDHVPQNHAIGGFFFWYDVYGRCLAIDALADAGRKRAFFERERKMIAGIAEIDGRFVDSHELGKPYGTAMALLSLKLAWEKTP